MNFKSFAHLVLKNKCLEWWTEDLILRINFAGIQASMRSRQHMSYESAWKDCTFLLCYLLYGIDPIDPITLDTTIWRLIELNLGHLCISKKIYEQDVESCLSWQVSCPSKYGQVQTNTWQGGIYSRSPSCVLLALSWNTTNENPSTDKLSRAIN